MIKVTRAPFFASLIISVLVGAAMAWSEGALHAGYLILTLLGVVATNAGLNMSNDYYDHLSGNDEINRQLTPFSGGSRAIQEGILSPRRVLIWALGSYAVAIIIGLYLALARGPWVLWLGIAGISVAFFTSAPPFKLNYLGHGLGELATFLGSGPLIVLGSYYVQVQQLTYQALWTSISVGLMGAALIWINEFPDYEADRAVGKHTLVVVLGRERAVWGYIAVLAAVYGVILAGITFAILPPALLVSLFTLPLAYKAVTGVRRFHSDIPKLVPANAATIQLYLATGLLLCVGYIIAGIV
jgi:1,4-dihydroxy-2-naphthoate octaprenyltransferase